MRTLYSYLFLLACIASLPTHALADTPCFGLTVTGTITSPGQSNTYTCNSATGDSADFTLVTTSGSLVPKIQVYNPTGQPIGSWSPYACNGSTIEANQVSLPAGNNTIIVSDCSSVLTGSYILYAQSVTHPAGALNLSFGQTQTGMISSAAQSNTYTFSANASDVVDFTIVATGSLSPKLRLYGPTGLLVSSAAPYVCNGSTLEMNSVTLSLSGTYTLLVGDCSDVNTGTYTIYVQRVNNPSGAVNLPFDETESGTISSVPQSNTYTFTAKMGDVADFTMVTTSGSLSPKLRLYGPSGQSVASASPYVCNGSTQEMNTVMLPASGTYTLLVGDCSDTLMGNYNIYAQLTTSDSVGGGNLPFGQTLSGSITEAAQSYTYTFGANANDVVDFTMVTTSGSLSPKIRVYNSAGMLIASGSPYVCSGSVQELNTVTLSAVSDTYTVLVGDCSDTNAGNYNIYLQRTNNPSGAPMLLMGQTQTGSIAPEPQSNSYVFHGAAGDLVSFTMDTTSGNLSQSSGFMTLPENWSARPARMSVTGPPRR